MVVRPAEVCLQNLQGGNCPRRWTSTDCQRSLLVAVVGCTDTGNSWMGNSD